MYNPMMMAPAHNVAMIPVMAQTQTALPYPANAFVTAPQQPNIANAIFQTALTNDPGIAPYSQMISWALANEIVSRASANALRIFGYNLYSNNQFNNNEFLELARLVAERVRLSVIRGDYQSVEQAIQVLVSDTYTLAAGANLRRFDGLSAHITNQVANDCLGAAQAIDRIFNEIAGMSQLSNQAQMGGHTNVPVMQGNNGGYTNFNQPPSQPIPTNAAIATISNKSQGELTAMERQLMQLAAQQNTPVVHESIQQRVQKSPLAGAYRANPAMNATAQAPVLHVGKNAPEYVVEKTEFDRQVQQAQAAPAMDVVSDIGGGVSFFARDEINNTPEAINDLHVKVEEVNNSRKFYFTINNSRYDIDTPADYGSVVWAPSALQPFHPLVCLNYQRLTYVRLSDGTVLAVVQQLPEGEYHMEYDKHAVNATYANKPAIVPQTQKPVEKPSYKDIDPTGMSIIRANQVDCLSVEDAINETYMTAYHEMSGQDAGDAFVFECRVLTPFIMRNEDDADMMHDELINLTCMKNFASAAEHINSLTDINMRERLGQFLTDRVNTVVRFELSMQGDPITNFVEDHAGLLSVVQTHYQGAIAETINSYQNRIIRSACGVVKAKAVTDAYQYFADTPDTADKILKQTLFVTRDITVTVVKYYSEELSAFFAKESCAVLENAHPQLREIIEQGLTVKHLDAKNISNSYLVTLDGYKFEISRALTQSAAYLIRRS